MTARPNAARGFTIIEAAVAFAILAAVVVAASSAERQGIRAGEGTDADIRVLVALRSEAELLLAGTIGPERDEEGLNVKRWTQVGPSDREQRNGALRLKTWKTAGGGASFELWVAGLERER